MTRYPEDLGSQKEPSEEGPPQLRPPGDTGESDTFDLFSFLAECWPFNSLDPIVIELLASYAKPLDFSAGDRLIAQGERGDRLLVVITGQVEVLSTAADGQRHQLGVVGERGILGEMALLTHEPRTADVVAMEDGKAIQILEAEFHRLVTRHPRLSIVLTQLLAQRLGRTGIDALGGKEFRGYLIRRRLGQGGMSVVYEAVRKSDQTVVALKMMNHRLVFDSVALKQFHQEAKIIKALEHPNILRVIEEFPAFYTYFIAMGFCEGDNLAEILHRCGPLPEPLARSILTQLSRAMRYAHQHRIVHSDIKPANVMLSRQGVVKLTDFGVAGLVDDEGLTNRGYFVGTPRYMAPEQFEGGSPKTAFDVYAFGALAFELISGRPLFGEAPIIRLIREKAVYVLPPREDLNPEMSAEYYQVLQTCLQVDPSSRELPINLLDHWTGEDLAVLSKPDQEQLDDPSRPKPELPPTLFE